MDHQHKTNEQLEQELLELRRENAFLKELNNKENIQCKNVYDEMVETNLKLTLAMQGGKMAWWEMDVPTGNVSFDKHKVEMLGYLPENFKHYKDFTALVHPKDLKRIMNAMKGHLEGTLAKYECEYRILASSGEYIWFHEYGSVIKRDSKGAPLICTGFVFNITDRKEADLHLLKIMKALDSAGDAIAIANSHGHHFYQNKALSNMFGYETAEETDAAGGGMARVKDPIIAKEMFDTISSGGSWSGELDMVTKNGRVFPAYERADAIKDKEENIIGIIGIITDISARKQSEKVFGDLIEKNPMSISIMDKDGFTLKANPAHFLLFGSATPPDYSIFDDLRIKGLEEYILLAKNGEVVHFPDIYYNVHDTFAGLPDKPVWVRAVLFPLTDPDGIIERFVFIHEDITQRKNAEESLRKSENMLQTVLDNFPGVVFWKDRQSNYMGCNLSFANGAGLKSPAEIVGKTDLEMPWALTEANNYLLEDINVMEHGKERLHIIETQHQSDGKVIWFDTSKFPLRDSNGQIIGVVGVSNDISILMKAKQTLIESEIKFRQIFDMSPIGIVLEGLDKKFLNCNQAFAKMLGYASEEIVGLSFEEVTFPEDILAGNSAMTDLIKGKVATMHIRKRYLRKDKRLIWTDLTISLFRDYENVPLYFLSNIQDITRLKETEDERDRLIAIIEQSSDYIGTSDMHGNLLYHNPAAKAILGLSADTPLLGVQIKDICSERFLDLVMNEGISSATRNGKWQSEIELKHFDGQEIPVSILLMVHKDKEGIPVYTSSVMRDITNIKLAEINLKKINEKIEAQNEEYFQINKELAFQNEEKEKRAVELIIAKDKAEASDRLKTAFISNISHEIRTPLNGILGIAPFIIQSDIPVEEKDGYIEILNSSSKRLMDTITNIMDISLIFSGNMEVSPQPIDISSLLRKVFEDFREPAKEKNLIIKMQFPHYDDQIILITDGEMLRKAVSKLVDNSVKFTKEGSVTLGFELINNEVEIFIKDTGVGIEKEAQELIYKYFMQEDVSKTRSHEGNGLGLSIAKGIIQLLDGEIRLESTKNVGTTVFLTLSDIISTASSKPIEKSEILSLIQKQIKN